MKPYFKLFLAALYVSLSTSSAWSVDLKKDDSIQHAKAQSQAIQKKVEEQTGKPGHYSKAINFRKEKALNKTPMSQLWHLSEGADMYPLAWMIRLKSVTP